MRTLPFAVGQARITPVADSAILLDGENPFDALRDAILQAVHLDIEVTIGGVTMFAAAWEDPDHWAEDWADKLGIDLDDVPQTVATLVADAIVES
jgi:hypothetical protein